MTEVHGGVSDGVCPLRLDRDSLATVDEVAVWFMLYTFVALRTFCYVNRKSGIKSTDCSKQSAIRAKHQSQLQRQAS